MSKPKVSGECCKDGIYMCATVCAGLENCRMERTMEELKKYTQEQRIAILERLVNELYDALQAETALRVNYDTIKKKAIKFKSSRT